MLSDAMMADHGKSTRPRALESSASIIKLDFSSFGPAGPVQFYTCATLHTYNKSACLQYYPRRLWAGCYQKPQGSSEAEGVAGAHDTPSQHVSVHGTTCAFGIVTFVGNVDVNVPNVHHVCVNVSF